MILGRIEYNSELELPQPSDGANTAQVRRGAALVELALSIPLLMLILAIIADFSQAYVVAKAVDNAASQGTYSGSTIPVTVGDYPGWAGGIEDRVRQALSVHAWYDPNQLIVTITQPSVSNGLIDDSGNVLFEIRTDYTAQHLIRLPGLPANYTVSRTLRIDKVR